MQITLPDLGLSEQEIKQELALSLYQQEKVSLAKAASIAGMTRIQFQQLMASRDICIHYDGDMLDEDIRNLQKLGRLP
jgi:predicted HTH domain antitoxin